MPEYARPLWIDLKNIFLRKRRIETLQEFCAQLQEFNLQLPSDIVHRELGLLPPEKALEARDTLSYIIRKEPIPDLCKFLKAVLEKELEVLKRMSLDFSDELKSLLRQDYESWMSVIQKLTSLDHDKFQNQVNSWFTSIQNNAIFEGDIGSSVVIEHLRQNIIKVQEKIATANVRLNFYRQLDKHDLQPSTKDLAAEFLEWPGDKSIVSRWQMFKTRSPNPDINDFFITELENLMADLQFESRELNQDLKLCFKDRLQYLNEMRNIQKLYEEKVKPLHQAKEELVSEKRRSDKTNTMSSGDHNLRRDLTNVMYRQACTNVNLNFYTKLENLRLKPCPDVYVRELAQWVGDKEDIYRKWSAFKETSNMNFTFFFKRELQELAAKLEDQSKELQRQFESKFSDKFEYHKELTKLSLSAQEQPIATVKQEKDELLELILGANKAEMKRKGSAQRDILTRQLTKIMVKKVKVDVHLNFYRRLQSERLEPTLAICKRDLIDWLGDRDGINRKWKIFMRSQNPRRTRFFINELEELKADLEQKSEKLETDFAELDGDSVHHQHHLENIHALVKNDLSTHKLKSVKDQSLNKLLSYINNSEEIPELPSNEEVSSV